MNFYSLPLDKDLSAGDVVDRLQETDRDKYVRNYLGMYPLVGRTLTPAEIAGLGALSHWEPVASHGCVHDHMPSLRETGMDKDADHPALPTGPVGVPLLAGWQEIGRSLFSDMTYHYRYADIVKRPTRYDAMSAVQPQSVRGQLLHIDGKCSGPRPRSVDIYVNTLAGINSATGSTAWCTRYVDCRSLSVEEYRQAQSNLTHRRHAVVARERARLATLPQRHLPANRFVVSLASIPHQAGTDPARPNDWALISFAGLRACQPLS